MTTLDVSEDAETTKADQPRIRRVREQSQMYGECCFMMLPRRVGCNLGVFLD